MFTDDQRQRKWTFPLDLLHWTFWQVKGNSHNQGSLTAPCFHPRIKQDLLPVGRNRTTPPNWSLSRLRSKKQKSTISAAPCVECLLTVLYLQRHRGISNIHHFSFFFFCQLWTKLGASASQDVSAVHLLCQKHLLLMSAAPLSGQSSHTAQVTFQGQGLACGLQQKRADKMFDHHSFTVSIKK